mmetsp:Transcript_87113/g.194776  ORF Transcript_87113/g.194776 Transcript_87113/m.194776 type:complete len:215 (+) Transcript_87113:79-723(+)
MCFSSTTSARTLQCCGLLRAVSSCGMASSRRTRGSSTRFRTFWFSSRQRPKGGPQALWRRREWPRSGKPRRHCRSSRRQAQKPHPQQAGETGRCRPPPPEQRWARQLHRELRTLIGYLLARHARTWWPVLAWPSAFGLLALQTQRRRPCCSRGSAPFATRGARRPTRPSRHRCRRPRWTWTPPHSRLASRSPPWRWAWSWPAPVTWTPSVPCGA